MRLISFFFIAVSTLLFASFAHADFSRMITNQSNDTWEITAQPDSKFVSVLFDGSFDDSRYERQFIACQVGSHLKNGPCILGPVSDKHHVSYIIFRGTPRGSLYFVNSNKTKQIRIKYWPTNNGIAMQSSDGSRINDNHADITIYPGAEK